MVVSTIVGENLRTVFANNTECLSSFKYFPQAVFLLQKDMTLLETNNQGNLTISKNHIGLNVSNKLHFNCKENDTYVTQIISELTENCDSISSQRFILRTVDMQHKVFTLALESTQNDSNLLLTMHDNLSSKNRMMQSLARAFNLTTSESKIVKMMVSGFKPKEIAYELGISLNTVRSHLRTLYAKMHVRSYNDALTTAIKLIG